MAIANLLTDEECEKIAELSKRSDLNLKGCNHTFRYFGLTVDERKYIKDDIEFLETTLRKWIPSLVSFSNFTGDEPNRIRCQTAWSNAFTGVSYFDLPHNNDWKIVDENDEVIDDLVNLTLTQAEDILPNLLNEGADAYIQGM